ncbi:hypothetical protein ACWD46_12470 [Streptomyces sp. NPDC002486]
MRTREPGADARAGCGRADAACLALPSDVGAPGAAEAVGALGLGVRSLVPLSARSEDQALPTEEALHASGADWTVVRAAWCAQHFSEGPPVAELRERGGAGVPGRRGARAVPSTCGTSPTWWLAALTSSDRYTGLSLTLSGARLLTFGEAVAEIAATGRPPTYRAVSTRDHGEAPAVSACRRTRWRA